MTTSMSNAMTTMSALPASAQALRALEITVSFDGAVLAVHELRPGQALVFGPPVAAGEGPQPDYPLSSLSAPLTMTMPLTGDDPLCAFPEDAAGAVRHADGRELTLQALREARLCESIPGGLRYALPAGADLWTEIAALHVTVRPCQVSPRQLPRAPLDLRAARFIVGSLLAHGALVTLAMLVPPDPQALASSDLSRLSNRALQARFIPPVPKEEKSTLAELAKQSAGGPAAPASVRRPSLTMVHSAPAMAQSPVLAPGRGASKAVDKELLKSQVKDLGVLSVLGSLRAESEAGRLFADEGALTVGARQALAGVTGVNGDDPYGAGPALVAAGPGGNCTGPGCDQTVLSGPLGTCKGASCVTGLGGHFTGAGPKLRQRKPAVITDMFASPPQVKGTLPAELVRRVIRSRMNEFRFCYERALAASRSGGDDAERRGRVVVSFLIGGDGRVLSAVTKEASLRNPPVQDCVAAVVRRLSFPQPEGGSLVQVSYPFNFQPAGE